MCPPWIPGQVCPWEFPCSLRSGGRAPPLHRWPHFFCFSYFLSPGSSKKWLPLTDRSPSPGKFKVSIPLPQVKNEPSPCVSAENILRRIFPVWEDCLPTQRAPLKGTGCPGARGCDVPLGSLGSSWPPGWFSLLIQKMAEHSGRWSKSYWQG